MMKNVLKCSVVLGLLISLASRSYAAPQEETAVFAGGCFWCMEAVLQEVPGVTKAVPGYTGGSGDNPTHADYAAKGHVEAVRVTYDPAVVSYDKLLDLFWRQINPTDAGGQFVDRGQQYRTVIFYGNEEQKALAEKSKEALGHPGKYDQPIVTEILPAGTFYRAEEENQDYYKRNPIRYKYHRFRSFRDQYLDKLWGR